MTRGLEADAEKRNQIRAPRNRDPREAETGPLVEFCPDRLAGQLPPSVNDGPMARCEPRPGAGPRRTGSARSLPRFPGGPNPAAAHKRLPHSRLDIVDAGHLDALDAVQRVCGTDQAALIGACAGGII